VIHYDMWFTPPGYQRFKVTIEGPDSETVMEMARLNYDFNVGLGYIPTAKRP